MRAFQLGALVALLVLSVALGACDPRVKVYVDRHGNHVTEVVD
jgi:hypothetical protein